MQPVRNHILQLSESRQLNFEHRCIAGALPVLQLSSMLVSSMSRLQFGVLPFGISSIGRLCIKSPLWWLILVYVAVI